MCLVLMRLYVPSASACAVRPAANLPLRQFPGQDARGCTEGTPGLSERCWKRCGCQGPRAGRAPPYHPRHHSPSLPQASLPTHSDRACHSPSPPPTQPPPSVTPYTQRPGLPLTLVCPFRPLAPRAPSTLPTRYRTRPSATWKSDWRRPQRHTLWSSSARIGSTGSCSGEPRPAFLRPSCTGDRRVANRTRRHSSESCGATRPTPSAAGAISLRGRSASQSFVSGWSAISARTAITGKY